MYSPQLTVGDLGEQGLLERVQRFCPTEIIGDDAALFEIAPDRSLVVTTDVLVDGVHFSNATTSPEDVGWRAAAANLSDLAAMGASSLGVTVGLALQVDVELRWVEKFYEGLQGCLKQYDTAILGGDICRSPVVTVSITAFGQVLPTRAIRRSSAQVGDILVVTGLHGASRGGLELLLHPDLGDCLDERDRLALIRAHQRPQPRLDVLPTLQEFWETSTLQSPLSIAGMDSSDGLADAVLQICRSSGVGAEIDRNLIPIPKALYRLVGSERALEWALYGGEDFELVLCLPEPLAALLVERLGGHAVAIGRITRDRVAIVIDSRGIYPQQLLSLEWGFQHF
ncbi:MAG: thiamine-phosphate kinase [Cyanobacteriota bacterium]|nr:thiamine-phosphate kinase [Cyanobacteriota bacterium]